MKSIYRCVSFLFLLLSVLHLVAIAQARQPDTSLSADGQLHIILCGTGSPLPDPARASSCVLVIAGKETFLIDSGPGSWKQVALTRIPTEAVRTVFLTHLHSDHIGDLGEAITQTWIAGRQEALEVVGPAGTDSVVTGFLTAYAPDRGFRLAHHGEKALPASAAKATARVVDIKADESKIVFNRNDVKVTAFRVSHEPVTPAFGYRIDFAGRSVVISGDTTRNANLARYAKGCDILIHEVVAKEILTFAAANFEKAGDPRRAGMLRDILTYHSSPADAAAVAAEAGAATLVLTHIVPPISPPVSEQMFLRGIEDVFKGKTVLARDGQRFDLPPAK